MVTRRLLFSLALAGLWMLVPPCSLLQAQQNEPTAAQAEFFEKSVRPLLVAQCLECHSGLKPKGKLRLDSRGAMMAGGGSGPVIDVSNLKESVLIKALQYDDELKMPPKGKLSAAQISVLTDWIQQGAPWPGSGAELRSIAESGFKISQKDREFWSFRPVADPPLPPVRHTAWPQKPLDHFILAKLEEQQLTPAGQADRRTLIRRVTLDLTGLPPTVDEINDFLKDDSAMAFAKVVDRLLASPQYGERAARHWLDVARFGEDQAHTFEARKYPQGFRYRDWVIKAFNDDMPYDRFIREQLAADLLPGDDRLENLPALGFFACGPVYYGDQKKLDQIDDRIDTLSRGLLGLTVACARCHDHKYDPISTKDYYSLAGVVASSDYVEISLEPGKVGQAIVPPPKKDKTKAKGPLPPLIHALRDTKIVTMKVHIRGNPSNLGEEAPHRFLSILDKVSHETFVKGSGRLELAEAITNPSNPLTARVMVNRVWQHLFGRGLVRTPSNFGALGERPTHPELLDYLTTRFIAEGWSVKALHREIVLSSAYQMATTFDAKAYEADGDNRWLWRMNRRRLEVEAWRDSILAAAGTLDARIGGPSMDLNNDKNFRRTLYGMVSRHELNSLLRLFDFPDPNITSEKRTVTIVPLQQLFVLNSEFMVRNAKALAARLNNLAVKDDGERIRQAFLLVYGRPPSDREESATLTFIHEATTAAASHPSQLSPWEQMAQALLGANELLFLD